MIKIVNLPRFIGRCIKVPFAISLVILAASQILLLFPFVGGSLPASGILDYEQVKSPTGRILVELEDAYQPNGNIKVLVNGNEAAALSDKSVELTVMNNSVIEIDGRQVNYPFEVTIATLDSAHCDGEYAAVDGNLVRLARVFAKNN